MTQIINQDCLEWMRTCKLMIFATGETNEISNPKRG